MNRRDKIFNLRQILIRRYDALRKALAGDLSLLKEIRAQNPGDSADSAMGSAEDDISSQLAEVESRELSLIEHALERMRSGHFGVCENCGFNIPIARLNALPYATRCIKCQKEAEGQRVESADAIDLSRLVDAASDVFESPIDGFDAGNL